MPPPNRLLAALSSEDCERVIPWLRTVRLRTGDVLQRHGEEMDAVYFPNAGATSIVNVMQDGRMAEVAMAGNEGLIGISAFLGGSVPAADAVVQVAGGTAEAMPIEVFRRELSRRERLYDVVSRYAQAFLALVMQSVACNGLHSVKERCCRWLLLTGDRVGREEFRLTQETLSIMLGVRRPTVTIVAGQLQRAGLISYSRGRLRIVNRAKLERAACECYQNIQQEFARLLP